MKTFLVTGGAGFIGSHVIDRLINNGKSVICLDNFNDYYSPKRKRQNILHHLKNQKFTLKIVDFTNKKETEKIFKENKIDVVIHLGARAGVRPSIKSPRLYQKTNVEGTLNLLELSNIYGIKKFIFGSSSSVYGKNKKIPFSENDFVDNPISPYAATKKACELFCYTYSYLTKLSIVCLRFFTVYGPRGRPDMAPYLFTKSIIEEKTISVFGDGSSKRDYTYVEDIVSGIISSINLKSKYEVINLGNSTPIQLMKFIKIIEKITKKKAKLKYVEMPKGDVPITYADITKAKKLLKYDPKTSIEKGLEKFILWYEKEF